MKLKNNVVYLRLVWRRKRGPAGMTDMVKRPEKANVMRSYPMRGIGFVSRYNDDFADIVYHLGSAYERCNLWPAYKSEKEFLEFLCEEVQETLVEADRLSRYAPYDCIENVPDYELDLMRGMAIKVMLEAIQVVSVLDKYEVCRLRANLPEESE